MTQARPATNFVYIDFEFRETAESKLDVISVAFTIVESDTHIFRGSFWLRCDHEKRVFAKFFKPYLATHRLVAYALSAEARCLFDLFPDLTPKDIKGLDLYLTYRLLLNHNDDLEYGKQLINGVEKFTKKPKPKRQRTEKDQLDVDNSKAQYSLAACSYKLLGIKIDTEEKTRVRDIIIEGSLVQDSKDVILAYGESDIANLESIHKSQIHYFKKKLGYVCVDIDIAQDNMADYAIRTAWMERLGYPVNVTELKCFTSQIKEILTFAAETVNKEHPEIGAFQFNKKTYLYIKKEKPIRDWVEKNHDTSPPIVMTFEDRKDPARRKMVEELIAKQNLAAKWKRTDKNNISLALDSFRAFYTSESESFGGSLIRYLKTKQSLNGFTPSKTKRGSFYDYVGKDNRVRPYFGIYGSQSSRSQPAATGFLPLKAHWMRYFIQAKVGRAITGIDYASQEFLIAALLSSDEQMIEAYASGDVYLAFGKAAGLIPKDGTKDTHKRERNICKTLVLGISYDMGADGLAMRLTQVTKIIWNREQAEDLISTFYEIYDDYKRWKGEILREYEVEDMLQLKDGWAMLGGNENSRSVGNFPVQGAGACIMRKAVALAQDKGIDVIFTLHDALYAEHDVSVKDTGLEFCMREAFQWYFDFAKGSELIRLDYHTWGSGLKEEFYVDEKGEKDLNNYRKFFS